MKKTELGFWQVVENLEKVADKFEKGPRGKLGWLEEMGKILAADGLDKPQAEMYLQAVLFNEQRINTLEERALAYFWLYTSEATCPGTFAKAVKFVEKSENQKLLEVIVLEFLKRGRELKF